MDKLKSLALILAVNKVGTIGHENTIPWKIKDDLPRFKRITSGNTVLMGRATFESLGCKPLPNRKNIVVSTTMKPVPGVLVARSPVEAIDLFNRFGEGDLFVIGGAKLYAEFFDFASRVFLTQVENTIEGDTKYLPKFEDGVWKVSSVQTVEDDGVLSHTYVNLVRR